MPTKKKKSANTPADKILIPEGFVIGGMSIFGLNWDGSDDEGDEQPDGTPLRGAWGDVTHNKTVIGCAIPIPMLSKTFGSTAKPSAHKVWVHSLVTGRLQGAEFKDKGPAVRVRRPIDGTWQLHNTLGHMDYGLKRYGSYKQFPDTFPVIFWIEDNRGEIKLVKGWDNTTGQVE